MKDGGISIGIHDLDKLAQVLPIQQNYKAKSLMNHLQRFVTLGNMPADLPNIEKLVEYETQKHGNMHTPKFTTGTLFD